MLDLLGGEPLDLLDLDADRGRFSYRSQTDDGNPSYADWHWVVAPDGSGARVQVTVGAHPRSFWRKVLFSRIRRRSLQQTMAASLRALGEHLTPQAPPAPRTASE